MEQRIITTTDGVPVYVATGATVWYDSPYTAHAKERLANVAIAAPYDMTEHGITGRGWEHVEDQAWTWRSAPPSQAVLVAGFDPADQAGTAAAVEHIARYARLDRARAAAQNARTVREKATAHAAAKRYGARDGDGLRSADSLKRAQSLVEDLAYRAILSPDEIMEIARIAGVKPRMDGDFLYGYGADRNHLPLYYGPAEIALARGVKRGTIDRYIADGRLPLPEVAGSAAQMWTAETVEAWVRQSWS